MKSNTTGTFTKVFIIPVKDKYIIYRPLLQLAFLGNRAMVDLVLNLVDQKPSTAATAQEEAIEFLETIGFLKSAPPSPPLPNPSYRPTTAVLLLTNRCNLRCTYCYASGGERPTQDLTPHLAQIAVDYVCQNAIEQDQPHFNLVFHGGGEPIQAWEPLQKATAHARGKHLPCLISMVSNGVWSEQQKEWVLHNLDRLTISFDGRQETQDSQRPFPSGTGSFRSVLHTIKVLDQAKFSYGIRMTATAPWRKRLVDDVRFICQETDCPVMQVEPAFNTRRGEHQGPNQEESEAFVEAFMEAFEVANEAGRRLTYSGARPWLLTHTFCTAPYSSLILNSFGNLVTCYEIADKNHPLAEISTIGCVVGDRIVIYEQTRNALLKYLEEKHTTCQDCFCYWHCAGDCYTRAYSSRINSLGVPSQRCQMNRSITAQLLLRYIMAGNGVWRGKVTGHPQQRIAAEG